MRVFIRKVALGKSALETRYKLANKRLKVLSSSSCNCQEGGTRFVCPSALLNSMFDIATAHIVTLITHLNQENGRRKQYVMHRVVTKKEEQRQGINLSKR